MLEEREYEATPYAHELRITGENEHGSVDVTVTRGGRSHQTLAGDTGGAQMFFRTRFSKFAGWVTWGGETHDLTTDAFGSACKIVPPATR